VSEMQGGIKNMGMLDLTSAKTPEELSNITALKNVGMILIPEHLTAALAGIPMQNVGGVVPVPQGVNVKLLAGQTKLTGEALANGDSETILIMAGQLFVTTPVEKVGYKELRVTGQLLAPRGSESAISAKLASITGQVIYYPEGARLTVGEESWSREFLSLLPEATPYVIVGKVRIEDDVTAQLLREKISEIVLVGMIVAPEALVPLVQLLAIEKIGRIEAIENQGEAEQEGEEA